MNIETIKFELIKLIALTNLPTKMSSFANIKGYHSKTNGETANHRVNLNFQYFDALAKDKEFIFNLDLKKHYADFKIDFDNAIDSHLEYLKKHNANENTISHFENKVLGKCTFDVFESAYAKSYNSAIKVGELNYNAIDEKDIKKASNRKNPFLKINDTIKYHPEYDRLYIVGQKIKNGKTTIIKGKLNETKNGLVVFARKVLESNFNSHNYRLFIFDRIDVLNALKNSFKGNEISL
jgi:hypothetical protein